jgi:hypothetical protein
LNPIEDAWKYMKNKLKTEDTSSVPSWKRPSSRRVPRTSAGNTWATSATPCPGGWRL